MVEHTAQCYSKGSKGEHEIPRSADPKVSNIFSVRGSGSNFEEIVEPMKKARLDVVHTASVLRKPL
jgi:hypothetical protein